MMACPVCGYPLCETWNAGTGDWEYVVIQCGRCKSSVRVAESPFDGGPVERYEAARRKAAEIWNGREK